jgi:hypothetical protein
MDIQYLLNVYDVNLTTLFTHFLVWIIEKSELLFKLKTISYDFFYGPQTFDY